MLVDQVLESHVGERPTGPATTYLIGVGYLMDTSGSRLLRSHCDPHRLCAGDLLWRIARASKEKKWSRLIETNKYDGMVDSGAMGNGKTVT